MSRSEDAAKSIVRMLIKQGVGGGVESLQEKIEQLIAQKVEELEIELDSANNQLDEAREEARQAQNQLDALDNIMEPLCAAAEGNAEAGKHALDKYLRAFPKDRAHLPGAQLMASRRPAGYWG